jgi:hypothetical protein
MSKHDGDNDGECKSNDDCPYFDQSFIVPQLIPKKQSLNACFENQ